MAIIVFNQEIAALLTTIARYPKEYRIELFTKYCVELAKVPQAYTIAEILCGRQDIDTWQGALKDTVDNLEKWAAGFNKK